MATRSSDYDTPESKRQAVLARATKLAGMNENFKETDDSFKTLQEFCSQNADEARKKLDVDSSAAWMTLQEKVKELHDNTKELPVDLKIHPPREIIKKAQPGSQITIGDIHGNSMTLIYILIQQGVLELNKNEKDYKKKEEDYKKLKDLYEKESLTKKDLSEFDDILSRAGLNPGASIRLIGDEVGDRGENDYFNLKIIEKLQKEHVPIEIIFSNHGAEFIDFYEHGCQSDYNPPTLGPDQARSVYNLSSLVKKGLITSRELENIVEKSYLPNLKAISYSIDEVNNHITIHSHAAIGLETIKNLASTFHVPYDESSPRALAKTIDEINKKFNELAVRKGISHALNEEQIKFIGKGVEPKYADFNAPLNRIIWSRYSADPRDELIRQSSQKRKFVVQHVHGHDGRGAVPGTCSEIVKNLDNDLGKNGLTTPGSLRIHYNFDMSSAQYRLYLEQERRRLAGLPPTTTISPPSATTTATAAATTATASGAGMSFTATTAPVPPIKATVENLNAILSSEKTNAKILQSLKDKTEILDSIETHAMTVLKEDPAGTNPFAIGVLGRALKTEHINTASTTEFTIGFDASPEVRRMVRGAMVGTGIPPESNITIFQEMLQQVRPPKTLLIPIGVPAGGVSHMTALAVKIDASGKADVLFFNSLSPGDQTYATPFIAAIQAKFPGGKVLNTAKKFQYYGSQIDPNDPTGRTTGKEDKYCGHWSVWFMDQCAKFPDANLDQLKTLFDDGSIPEPEVNDLIEKNKIRLQRLHGQLKRERETPELWEKWDTINNQNVMRDSIVRIDKQGGKFSIVFSDNLDDSQKRTAYNEFLKLLKRKGIEHPENIIVKPSIPEAVIDTKAAEEKKREEELRIQRYPEINQIGFEHLGRPILRIKHPSETIKHQNSVTVDIDPSSDIEMLKKSFSQLKSLAREMRELKIIFNPPATSEHSAVIERAAKTMAGVNVKIVVPPKEYMVEIGPDIVDLSNMAPGKEQSEEFLNAFFEKYKLHYTDRKKTSEDRAVFFPKRSGGSAAPIQVYFNSTAKKIQFSGGGFKSISTEPGRRPILQDDNLGTALLALKAYRENLGDNKNPVTLYCADATAADKIKKAFIIARSSLEIAPVKIRLAPKSIDEFRNMASKLSILGSGVVELQLPRDPLQSKEISEAARKLGIPLASGLPPSSIPISSIPIPETSQRDRIATATSSLTAMHTSGLTTPLQTPLQTPPAHTPHTSTAVQSPPMPTASPTGPSPTTSIAQPKETKGFDGFKRHKVSHKKFSEAHKQFVTLTLSKINVAPQRIKDGFDWIKDQIQTAAASIESEPHPLKGVTLQGSVKNFTLEIPRQESSVAKDKITQEVDAENTLRSKLHGSNPEDHSYVILALTNAHHQPLDLHYNPNRTKILKTLEACFLNNVAIVADDRTKKQFLEDSTCPVEQKELFQLLTERNGQGYKDRVTKLDEMDDKFYSARPLGDPLPESPSAKQRPPTR